MLVLLTKTLTSHVYCESLTFPSEKGGIVLLGIRVHSDPQACLWEALPPSCQVVGNSSLGIFIKIRELNNSEIMYKLFTCGKSYSLIFRKWKDFYQVTLQCIELLTS